MTTTSNTAVGQVNACPRCKSPVQVASTIFLGETCCAQCDGPLWFIQAAGESRFYDREATEELRNRAQHFVAQRLEIDPDDVLNSTVVLEELGVDSMDTLELLMELEEELERDS